MTRGDVKIFSFSMFAKRLFASFIFACVLVAGGYVGIARVQATPAAPPRIVMYQGRLLNSNNVPLSDTSMLMSFAFYTDPTAGTCLWSNNSATCASVAARNVTLNAGLFSEALGGGDYAAIGSEVFSENASVYLQVTVNGESLLPRKQMLATPYAMNADVLDGMDSTIIGSTVKMIPAFNSFGNLVITGAPQTSAGTGASLSVNPDVAGVVANEMLFGVSVSSVDRFTVDAEGDAMFLGSLDAEGMLTLGSASSFSEISFTSAVTTENASEWTLNSLTSGSALNITRGDDLGPTEYSGTLVSLENLDTSGGSGDVLKISNKGGTGSIGLIITQNTTSAHVADDTGNNALVIDIFEDPSADDAVILRSGIASGGAASDTEFRITSAGDVYADGAFSGAGADFAEYFSTTDGLLQASLLACTDSLNPSHVERCSLGAQNVLGVISTNPAFIGNIVGDGAEDLRNNPAYRLVGLVGQIDTKVNTDHGAISVGDPIAVSTTVEGYGAKANGPTRIIGFALESLLSGSGTIRVLVQPHWYAGDVFTKNGSATQVSGSLAIAAVTAATSATSAMNSANLELRGSAWTGAFAETREMSLRTTVAAADDYRLSVTNNDGIEVASISHSGDLSLAGKFYPSDRGAVQDSAYIYYDGSAGIGGSFMRTNSSGWATGSYDFAEMFASRDGLQPGEVVVFGDEGQYVKRSTGETYSQIVAGIVSTKPGFLAGENRAGSYPIALAGRVPTFVSTENGAIHIGDPLTTASMPGFAMRATEAGPILGYAAESFSGITGSIVVYVNVSYYAGTPVEEGPGAENSISKLTQDIENFDTSGVLNFNGGQLLAIGSLAGSSGSWRLESSGDLVTSGRLIQLVQSVSGENVETYAAASREMTVQLSGTVALDHGRASVRFSDIDPKFVSIIDINPTYRALVTPYGATGSLYVTNRTVDGFDIVESGTASSGVDVDWIVIAYRRDFAPSQDLQDEVDEIVPAPVIETGGANTSGEANPIPEPEDGIDDAVESPAVADDGVVDGVIGEDAVVPVVDSEVVESEILSHEESQAPIAPIVADPVAPETSSNIDPVSPSVEGAL
ncbi:MAG: hypothetical protein WCT28_00365 [Patescibacteria group bacterium]|jgi:hypothetical protein